MAQPLGSLQDKDFAAYIVDVDDRGVNRRVELMNSSKSIDNLRSASSGIAHKIISTTLLPIISMRLTALSTKLLEPISISVFCGTSEITLFQIIKNPILVTASWISVAGDTEYDVTSATYSGGTVLYQDYFRSFNASASISMQQALFQANRFILEPGDIITLSAKTTTGTGDYYGAINAREIG